MMKKNLLLLLMACLPVVSISQSFPIHDVDECLILTEIGSDSDIDFVQAFENPDLTDDSSDVSQIEWLTEGNNRLRLALPNSIPEGSTINFTARFYSPTAGSIDSGAGKFQIRLYNSNAGFTPANDAITVGDYDKVGGSWQTISESLTLTSTNSTIQDEGYNAIFIISNRNAITPDDLFFDNIELSIDISTLANDNADLLEGNVWVYNNRPGDNQNTFDATFGDFNVVTTPNVTTPSTDGNSATEVIQVDILDGFSANRFPIEALDPPFSGTVKFRIYNSTCNLDYTNNIRISLRKDFENDSQFSTNAANLVNVPTNLWTEASFDLSTLTTNGTPATGYNQLLIIYDQGDGGQATGSTYYLDAIQSPEGTLSNDFFNKDDVKVFMSSTNNLRIIGLDLGDVALRLFDLTGKEVMATSFKAQATNNVLINDLSTGVYIVGLSTQYGKINKKIFLK